MDEAHTLLVEADAQLNGIRNMTVQASENSLEYLKGFELDMMLKPISERLERAMQLIG